MDRWPNKVVFQIYCNDDLKTLPIAILEQMRQYLEELIADKEKINEKRI